MKYNKVSKHIVGWLSDYIEKNNLNGFVLGVSGGIDSAVCSTLCAMTGKPLTVIEMPIHQELDEVTRATNHINWLKSNFPNVKSLSIDLTQSFEEMRSTIIFSHDEMEYDEISFGSSKVKLAYANLRSRLRMCTLYTIATFNNSIVCGTGNKVEDYGIKFFTKYGDGGVDISPIGDLMKSEVYLLGAELGLLEEILNAVPTDGLWEGSPTDEDQIGASYDELEWALSFIDDHTRIEQGVGQILEYDKEFLSERQHKVLEIYSHRNKIGQHKMEMPPVCYIPENFK